MVKLAPRISSGLAVPLRQHLRTRLFKMNGLKQIKLVQGSYQELDNHLTLGLAKVYKKSKPMDGTLAG